MAGVTRAKTPVIFCWDLISDLLHCERSYGIMKSINLNADPDLRFRE